MTGAGSGGEAPSGGQEQDPAIAYFESVQEHFLSRRGDPLILSNADWFTVNKWRQAGVPLRVVLRGIEDAFETHAHSFQRRQRFGSLRSCHSAVEAAFERWRRALAVGYVGEQRWDERAVRLVQALEAASLSEGPLAAQREGIVAGLGVRAQRHEAPEALETWLRGQEQELLVALRRELASAGVARIEAEVEADLAPYEGRMPVRVLDQVRVESVMRRTLEAFGLPRLSLFELT